MKKSTILLAAVLTAAMANAQDEIITLDLTKSITPLEFDATNGSWTGTYDDEAESIDSQVFSFVHGSMSEWQTWWGFTASNHADNTRPENTLIQQWSNMAKGGIVLNEDGTVKTDSFGAPEVSADVPYIVAFYSTYMSARPLDMSFADGKAYQAVGVYVNLNSYPYYSIECGDGYARAFTNGDKYTLTIHGVSTDETEKSIDVTLAEYSNGNLTINRGWKYVDLSSLGVVNEIYFTMDSTDSGDYGMNTPAYFCLDKLMVSPVGESEVMSVGGDSAGIVYDKGTNMVRLPNAGFAMVFDMEGRKVLSAEGETFSVASLSAGVYVVKSGNRSLKFVK
ncbi:MAG: DUF4465 domain-containing protein [Muribaculaceae bacterium]|nr:DUF4465 domain-containing protein [Muribaculaceae bacterium]